MKRPTAPGVLLALVLFSISLHIDSSFAQFGAGRAIGKAIDMNTRNAMERVQLALSVKNNSGKVVVQKTSSDGRFLLLVFADNQPRLWDLEESRYWDSFEALTSRVVAGAISSESNFVTIQDDGSIAYWDYRSSKPVRTQQTDLPGVGEVEIGRGGNLVMLDNAGGIHLLASSSIRLIGQVPVIEGARPAALALDPTGEFLAAAQTGGAVTLWSLRTGAPVSSVTVEEPPADMVFGSEAGQLFIATGSRIAEWDTTGQGAIGTYHCPDDCAIKQLLVNPASQSLIALTAEGSLLRWRLGGYTRRPELVRADSGIESISTTSIAPMVILAIGEGMVRFTQLDRPDEDLTFLSSSRGWALVDDLGRFDGSMGTDSGIFWENQAFSFPIANFLDTHFEPGLLTAWLGQSRDAYLTRPRNLDEGVLLPPRIEIELGAPQSQGTQAEIRVTVTVTDQGGGLGEPQLYHLGLRVSSDKLVDTSSFRHEGREARSYDYRVRALPGNNTFRAYVKDTEGVSSPSRASSLTIDGLSHSPDMHILAVAIDDYGSQGLNLNYSIADAGGLVAQLEKGAGALFEQVHAHKLTNRSATRDSVLTAFRNLRSAKPEDVIVVYVATHGDVVDEEFYILLQGLQIPLRQRSIDEVGISIAEIAVEIEKLDARRVLLLLDTCKSGDALDKLKGDTRDRRALRIFSNQLGVHMIAATAKGQMAYESEVLGHGIFTYSVINALKGDADRAPADGLLSASELADYAESGVPALSAQYSRFPQWPTIYSRGFDFSLAKTSPPAGAGL